MAASITAVAKAKESILQALSNLYSRNATVKILLVDVVTEAGFKSQGGKPFRTAIQDLKKVGTIKKTKDHIELTPDGIEKLPQAVVPQDANRDGEADEKKEQVGSSTGDDKTKHGEAKYTKTGKPKKDKGGLPAKEDGVKAKRQIQAVKGPETKGNSKGKKAAGGKDTKEGDGNLELTKIDEHDDGESKVSKLQRKIDRRRQKRASVEVRASSLSNGVGSADKALGSIMNAGSGGFGIAAIKSAGKNKVDRFQRLVGDAYSR
jgi:hypothetical protein